MVKVFAGKLQRIHFGDNQSVVNIALLSAHCTVHLHILGTISQSVVNIALHNTYLGTISQSACGSHCTAQWAIHILGTISLVHKLLPVTLSTGGSFVDKTSILAHNNNSSFQNICQDTGQSWNFSVYVPISYLFKCLHSWTRMILSWLVTLLE